MRRTSGMSAVVYARDAGGVGASYAAILGVQLSAREDDFYAFDLPGGRLVVLAIPDAVAADIDIDTPPARRTGNPVKLGLPVASIATARAAAASAGGTIYPPEREWAFRGERVCDGTDPEGNVVQLREQAGWGSAACAGSRGGAHPFCLYLDRDDAVASADAAVPAGAEPGQASSATT